MKIKENITLYCCGFCRKELKVKHAMAKHESNCVRNPKNIKPCMDCAFMEREERDVEFITSYHGFDGETMYQTKNVSAFRCRKFEKTMFPFQIERKELHIKFPETYEDQEPMPNECAEWKYEFDEPNAFNNTKNIEE